MPAAVWLAAPYVSMLLICRIPAVGARVAGHTALTLPVGWLAVLGVFGAVAGAWHPPLWTIAVLGALSGLAMIVTGGGEDDNGGEGRDPEDEPPPPATDWDAFDRARSRWERVGPRLSPRPERSAH